MNKTDLVLALRRLKVETGSLVCLSCGYEHNCSISGCRIIREAADAIENQTEWISVKDRLPEVPKGRVAQVSRTVVCYCDDGYVYGFYWYSKRKWLLESVYGFRPINVTHWMPLPDPPDVETVLQGIL